MQRFIPFILCLAGSFMFLNLGYLTELSYAGESGTFTGTWVANGTRKDVLPFGEDRETALFNLSGHVNLKDQIGNQTDYWSKCIGLADTKTGNTIHCTWRSMNGQELYLTLKSQRFAEGSEVVGTIIGGTGSTKGITGSIDFKWSSMVLQSVNDYTTIGGYAKELKGSYKLP